MRTFGWVGLVVIFALGLGAADVPKPPVGPEVKTQIDKKAEETLRAVTAQFTGLKAVEADMSVVVRIEGPGFPKQELPSKYSLAVERPNRFALILKEGATGSTLVSDGTNVTTYVPMLNRFAISEAPKDLSGMKEGANDGFGGMAFVSALFEEKPYEALLAGVSEVKHAGEDGTSKLQKLEFRQEGMNWTLFAETGDKPALRRIETDLSKLQGADGLPAGMEELMKNFKMTMSMEFANWKFNPTFGPDRFKFTPPAGAQKSDDLLAGLGAAEEEKDGEDSDLIGEPAPKFKAALLAGGEFDSASVKEQPLAVVFWAGEADHTSKVINTINEWAPTANVKTVFINVSEPKEKAAELVGKHKWKGAFAADPEGKIAEEFEVEGVPKTFLIDRHGAIQRAYLGFHEDLKTLLADDAKTLAAPAKSE